MNNKQLALDVVIAEKKASSLVESFTTHVKKNPELTIFTFINQSDSESLNYSELSKRINNIISLIRSKYQVGDRAILIFNPGLDFIATFLACLFSGIIAVPLYPSGKNKTKRETLAHVVNNCQAKGILTTQSLADDLDSELLNHFHLNVFNINNLKINKAIEIDYYMPEADNIAFLQYTSGSTGNPKGVIITHRNLIANQEQIQKISGHTDKSIGVTWLPPYHDMGLIGGLLQPLYVGFPVVIMAPSTFVTNPFMWLKTLSDYQATTTCAPNFSFDLCVKRIKKAQVEQLNLTNLAVIFNGAEPISLASINAFSQHFQDSGFNKESFFPCYGMAEATLILTGRQGIQTVNVDTAAMAHNNILLTDKNEKSSQIVSCGRVVEGVGLTIVNSESQQQIENGHIGEIWVSGANIAAGYWNELALSKSVFSTKLNNESIWMKTGDLGFVINQQLYITGRIKDLIIIRGKNFYPQDIEAIVSKNVSAVNNNAVAAFSYLEESADKEQLALVCELTRQAYKSDDHQQLCQQINKLVTKNFEIQVHTIVLIKPATLPKTTSGKIRRFACKSDLINSQLASVYQWLNPTLQELSHVPEESPFNFDINAEHTLTIWMSNYIKKVTGITDDIDTAMPFDELGMDSLSRATFLSDLSEYVAVNIPTEHIVNYSTIAELSRYLSAYVIVKDGLSNLSPDEQQQVINMIAQNEEKSSEKCLEDIPIEFQGIENYLPYKSLMQRNIEMNKMGLNPEGSPRI
jgi:acyl-CoA synthetase (AMP-forming)/AMP-acid ligase II/acyl carrier protein